MFRRTAVRLARNKHVNTKHLDDAYYNTNKPKVSDSAYDALGQQTQKVGAAVRRSPIHHRTPMRSLANARLGDDDDVLTTFLERVRQNEKTTKKKKTDFLLFVVEHKYDGLAVSATYQRQTNGTYALHRVATRGDGRVGEDVSEAAKFYIASSALPWQLENVESASPYIEVRGEVILAKSQTRELSATGATGTARNVAAGLLMRKLVDQSDTARQGVLQLRCYALCVDDLRFDSYRAQVRQLRAWGLPRVSWRKPPLRNRKSRRYGAMCTRRASSASLISMDWF